MIRMLDHTAERDSSLRLPRSHLRMGRVESLQERLVGVPIGPEDRK